MISPSTGRRAAVIGAGNELRGDDAAGIISVRLLKKYIKKQALQTSHNEFSHPGWGDVNLQLLIIEAGTALENVSGPLRRFMPELVVIVDAADMQLPPGTCTRVEWESVTGFSGSTHLLPPTVFARFLVEELGCKVIFIGIQPVCIDFDTPMTSSVARAVKKLGRQILDTIQNDMKIVRNF